jgi:hypothetical protein
LFFWEQVTTIISNIVFSIAVYNLCPDRKLVIMIMASSVLFSLINFISDDGDSPFEPLSSVSYFSFILHIEAVVRVLIYIFIWGYWGLAFINRILFTGGVLDHLILIYGFWLFITIFIPYKTSRVNYENPGGGIDFDSYPILLDYLFILTRFFPLLFVIGSVIKHLMQEGNIVEYVSSHWSDVSFSIPFTVFCIYSVCAVVNCIVRFYLCNRYAAPSVKEA